MCETRHRRAASLTLKPCPLRLGAHRSLRMAAGGQQRAALLQQGWKRPAEFVSEARGSVRSSGFSHSSRISNVIKPPASTRGAYISHIDSAETLEHSPTQRDQHSLRLRQTYGSFAYKLQVFVINTRLCFQQTHNGKHTHTQTDYLHTNATPLV